MTLSTSVLSVLNSYKVSLPYGLAFVLTGVPYAVTAGGKDHLKSLPLSKLVEYANAYNIRIDHVIEKEDVIEAILSVRVCHMTLSQVATLSKFRARMAACYQKMKFVIDSRLFPYPLTLY